MIITPSTMWLCQLLQGPLGPPSGLSSGPPGLQKRGSNVGNLNIVLPGQTSTEDVTYVFDSKKKLTLKQNNEPFKNNWMD